MDFFSQNYYVKSIKNSLIVSSLATLFTLIIGVPLAYFYQMYEIKGKTLLQIIIILCSMSAPFIGAYSWIMLLGRSGIVTKFLEGLLGITMPNIYGFNGILLVLSLQLFPLVFLYVSGALKNIDNSLLEASENMGTSGAKRFIKELIDDEKLKAENYDANGNVKIGYVGAFPYAEVKSGYTSYFLGVRSIVDNCYTVFDILYYWNLFSFENFFYYI